MRAIVHHEYGPPADVIRVEHIDKPVVEDSEVLVRVLAASSNPADWHAVRGQPYIARLVYGGLRRPKDQVPGCDLAGQVEAVGKDVTTLRPGDEVFGSPFGRGLGAFAEYASLPEDHLARKPQNLSFDHAATVPLAASTALQGLRDHGRLEPGHRVLVIGASGGVGTFAVQIAREFGAEVTGVCSTRNVEMVRSIGAAHVIDYTKQDLTQHGQRYDLVFQLSAAHSPSDCRRVLAPGGTLLLAAGDSENRWIGPVGHIIKALVISPFLRQKTVTFGVTPNREDLQLLTELIEAGKVTPVIDRTYPLDEIPEAIRYVEEGHTRGKVVITV